MSSADQEQLVDRFVTVTNSSKYLAEQFLSRNNYDLVNAIEDYYATAPQVGNSNKGSERKKKKRYVENLKYKEKNKRSKLITNK